MAKQKLPDATLTQNGPGSYLARYYNPNRLNAETGELGDWETINYIDGFAQAKMGLLARKEQGRAQFDRLIVVRPVKGKY